MEELRRKKKVIDMMITAHSVLRDHYNRRASIFETFLLIASIVLNALIFVDAKFIEKFTGLNDDCQKLITGLSCLCVFIISMVMLQVSWRAKATQHNAAAENLFQLKQRCRDILKIQVDAELILVAIEFDKEYIKVLNSITKIPDNKFIKLKLIHNRKVELSKLIDEYPTTRLWILKWKLIKKTLNDKGQLQNVGN
jgi:hypothetical protein